MITTNTKATIAIKEGDRVYAVINNRSTELAWMRRPGEKVMDKALVIESYFDRIDDEHPYDDTECYVVLEGGYWGVFEVPASNVFLSETEAKKVAREYNDNIARKLMEETSTVEGLLRFLVDNNLLSMPTEPIANRVLWAHMEDAGIGFNDGRAG
jgi:hypothetical protein